MGMMWKSVGEARAGVPGVMGVGGKGEVLIAMRFVIGSAVKRVPCKVIEVGAAVMTLILHV